MVGSISLVFALGIVAGLMLLRRGWRRTFALLLGLAAFSMAITILGIVPPGLLPQDQTLAIALLLTPPPLVAGLLCGALTAWLLRRVGS